MFQEDKDLVHAFVALGGLNCLVRVGNCADQNYQNYILRALGQVSLSYLAIPRWEHWLIMSLDAAAGHALCGRNERRDEA